MLYQTSEQQNSQIFHTDHAGSSFVRTLGSNYKRQRQKTAKSYNFLVWSSRNVCQSMSVLLSQRTQLLEHYALSVICYMFRQLWSSSN